MHVQNYARLIALDMDGTLLNGRKEVSERNLLAVREAASRGIAVVYGTGRAVCELEEFFTLLPEMRYAVFASGAGLYDVQERRAFGLRAIPAELSLAVLDAAAQRRIMPQIVLADCDAVQRSHMAELEDFCMGVYRPMYERAMTQVEDIQAFGRAHAGEILKINLYHTSPEERARTLKQVSGLQLDRVFSEITSLEFSAPGVNKGSGLAALCGYLNLNPADCAAVGDALNDLPMLKAVGLGIAVGNAKQAVKDAAGTVVSDNDHDGCAEAIRLYMRQVP